MEESWSECNRRRGRRRGQWLVAGGCGLLVLLAGVLVAGGAATGMIPLLILALLVPAHLILHGWRRITVESSPPVQLPLLLPAASDPGAFARLPEPRAPFGLRLVAFRPLRAAAYLGIVMGIPMAVLARAGGAAAALGFGALWVGIEGWNAMWFLRSVALEVRVADGMMEWKARFRREVIPVTSLQRWRCNTLPSTATVLEFEGHPPRIVLVTGGFADFMEALTTTCPWVEVSSDVVDRFGAWSGRSNGFFVESSESTAHSG